MAYMDVVALVTARGGVMHRSSLRAAGVTGYRIRAELAANRLRRVGRDRVASLDAPSALVLAAGLGMRVTCITAAQLSSLWVQQDDALHLSAPLGYSARAAPDPRVVRHWGRLPITSTRDSAVEPLVNALVHISTCQPIDYAAATFDSALNRGQISRDELTQLASVMGGRFAEVVALVDRRADAGGETLTRVRLGRRGVIMRPQVVIDGHPVDGLIGRWLVIQVDGYEYHSDPRRRAKDLAQDRRLALRGYTVLRFPSWSVEHDWRNVENTIMHAMAQGLHDHPISRRTM